LTLLVGCKNIVLEIPNSSACGRLLWGPGPSLTGSDFRKLSRVNTNFNQSVTKLIVISRKLSEFQIFPNC